MRRIPALLLISLLMHGCSKPTTTNLAKGDILFQNLGCGDLCAAINAVTEGVDGKKFSHCGLVVQLGDSLCVIEAIGSAVQLTALRTFFARSGDTALMHNITVGRLKHEYANLIDGAVDYALHQLGVPYDSLFLMNNGSLYCSELIHEAFREANGGADFFTLKPMTFKMPSSTEFFPAWVDYYRAMGADIPEGEPGTNPGLISTSDKIQIIAIQNIQ